MENLTAKDRTPLGAYYNKEAKSIEFRLYSKNAKKILLCIFDRPQGENPVMALNMDKTERDIWYTSVKDYVLNCCKKTYFLRIQNFRQKLGI